MKYVLPTLVLDKSYLDARKEGAIWDLCLGNDVLMVEHLFFELLTTDPTKRRRAFRKFPPGYGAVKLIGHVGTLLKFERENHRSCLPIVDRCMEGTFRFNRGLALETLTLTQQ